MTAAATPPRPYRREATGAVPFDSFAAGAEEVDDGADGWEGIALGWGEADIEFGFESVAEFDQVERVTTKIINKGSVEVDLRRREVEVPRDDGLDACLYGSFHLPRILPLACQWNVNAIKTIPALFHLTNHPRQSHCRKSA